MFLALELSLSEQLRIMLVQFSLCPKANTHGVGTKYTKAMVTTTINNIYDENIRVVSTEKH